MIHVSTLPLANLLSRSHVSQAKGLRGFLPAKGPSHFLLRWLGLFFLGLPLTTLLAIELEVIASHSCSKGGGEIIDYETGSARLVSTVSADKRFGIELIDIQHADRPGSLGVIPIQDRSTRAISSVAVDPLGRGFAVATMVPRKRNTQLGSLALIDLRVNQVVKTLPVGFHPDSVTFDKRGRFVIVANEGEHVASFRRSAPGSLSVIDVESVRVSADLLALDADQVATVTMRAPSLLENLRIPVARRPEYRYLDVEPEFITTARDLAYVTLQENNAIGVFHLRKRAWVKTYPLGRLPLVIDASDRDGPFGSRAIALNDQVHGLPMPDSLTSFRIGSRTYLATANEGDPLSSRKDSMRAKRAGAHGPSLDPSYRQRLKERYGSDPLLDANLGRLQVSTIDGDTDGDGDLDELTAFGTRSFSIWDAATGTLVYDSGNTLQRYVRAHHPKAFNMNRGVAARYDTRSDNRGGEVEAITSGRMGNRTLVFVAAERQNMIFAFDVTNPRKPSLEDALFTLPAGHDSPESLRYIPGASRKDGRSLLVAAFEGSETLAILEVRP